MNLTSILAKHLDASQRATLAESLASQLTESPQVLEPLLDLVDDSESASLAYSTIAGYVQQLTLGSSTQCPESWRRVSKICAHFPSIHASVTKAITEKMLAFVQFVKPSLQSEHLALPNSEEKGVCDRETLLGFLKLLEVILRENTNGPYLELDLALLELIGLSADGISSCAMDVMRWRIGFVRNETLAKVMWHTIFDLLDAEKDNTKIHGYLLWLRYLGGHPSLASDGMFQTTMQQNKYWKYVQLGLGSTSHKLRKYALSILQLSVSTISTNIQLELMTWNVVNSDAHMEDWKRFVTLFEILGVDTSLHQADAASADISRLISPESHIHPSWGFCLLSTGFKASTDSIQRLSMSLFMSIDPVNLHLIKHGVNHFRDIFLPYMMIASHFMVRNVQGKDNCEYGVTLTNFLASLLRSMDNDSDVSDFANAILTVLQRSPECFDPARIYVLQGLTNGLDSRRVLLVDVHGLALTSLIANRSEGEVYQSCNSLLCLRTLCLVSWDNVNSMNSYFTQFIRRYGYSDIHRSIPALVSAWKHVDSSEKLSGSLEFSTLVAKVKCSDTLPDVSLLDCQSQAMFLASGLYSQTKQSHTLVEIYEKLLDGVIEGRLTASEISLLARFEVNDKSESHIAFNVPRYWDVLKRGVASDDIETLRATLDSYCVFNNALGGCPELFDVKELVPFKASLLKNASSLNKSVKDFYKIRELFNAEFYSTLSCLAPFDLAQKLGWDRIYSWLTPNSSDCKGNFAMVQVLKHYVTHEATSENSNSMYEEAVELLANLWEHLDSTRLQLNQKHLHLSIIENILSPTLIGASCINSAIADAIARTLLSVINNAHTRRSLAPKMMQMIVEYQSSGHDLSSVPWLPQVLVKLALITTPKTNFYRLEPIMGEFYNQIRSSWSVTESIFEGELSSDDLYSRVHGVPEVACKINLYGLLRSEGLRNSAQTIVDYILDNDDEYQLIKIQNPTDGHQEWRRIQLLAMILTLSDKTHLDIDLFVGLLGTESSPLAKVYIEWIVSLACVSRTQYTLSILDKLRTATDLKAQLHVSYQRCLYLVAQQLPRQDASALLLDLLPIVIAGATSNKAVIRHSSLSLAVAARDEMLKKQLSFTPSFITVVESIHAQTIATNSFVQFKNGDALLWNILGDFTLVGITGGVLKRVSDRPDVDFIGQDQYQRHLSPGLLSELQESIGSDCEDLWVGHVQRMRGDSGRVGISLQPLQTKSGAWNVMVDTDTSNEQRAVTRSDLIVVSSLVSKAPNLGGICRLCDVLGAGLLTLGDIKVKNNTQFKSVAVTADQWMPMIQVTPDDVRDYLLQKKREGYTLIGLEQTDQSVELNRSLIFPKKTLILLGREKEGIPGDLLAELDTCVEIKQVGIIRSMNIQTATAVIVHAYASQHC